MTIREAIETVDRLTPNQYENIDKVRWLSELDGVVYKEIEQTHAKGSPVCEPWVRVRDPFDREEGACCEAVSDSDTEGFTGYPEEVDLETVLRIPWPYDEIYRWYLEMKIADANGEMTRYNNAAAKYNSYYSAYQNAYNRENMPRMQALHFQL